MPRQLFVKFRPIAEKLRSSWYFRALGPRLTDPRLWGLNRRAITMAFGTSIAICFIPLPAHLVIALLAAMIWRLNVPTIAVTLLVFNPFTAFLFYGVAYWVGTLLLHYRPDPSFHFELSWDWLEHGLGARWKPFLLGCLVCSVVFGYLSYRILEIAWRMSAVNRFRARRAATREKYPPL